MVLVSALRASAAVRRRAAMRVLQISLIRLIRAMVLALRVPQTPLAAEAGLSVNAPQGTVEASPQAVLLAQQAHTRPIKATRLVRSARQTPLAAVAHRQAFVPRASVVLVHQVVRHVIQTNHTN